MSHDLTEVASFDSVITVPDDGDPGLASSVTIPLQSLADRTQFLKMYTDQIPAGVPGIQMGSTSQMQNTIPGGGATQFYNETYGLFFYLNDGGALTADGVLIFDSFIVSGAHWFRYDWLTGDSNGGAPLIGPNFHTPSLASGKIKPSVCPYAILDPTWIGTTGAGTPLYANATTTYTSITNWAWNAIPFLAGDILEVDVYFTAWAEGSVGGSIRTSFQEDATPGLDSEEWGVGTGDENGSPWSVHLMHTVATPCGLVGLFIDGKADGASTSVHVEAAPYPGGRWLRWRIVRP